MTAGALIVAAGFSRRFGSDKRRHPISTGEPLLLATLKAYSAVFPTVAVVLRSEDGALAQDLVTGMSQRAPIIVPTGHAHLGMGHSLADGIRAVSSWDYVFVGLGDMPFVRHETLGTLRQRMSDGRRRGDSLIVQPTCEGRPGHPVGFACEYFADLMTLTRDAGARSVVDRHQGEVEHVECPDPGVLTDIDRPEKR
jgi:molybdenum cofactor cytidylyltransferase